MHENKEVQETPLFQEFPKMARFSRDIIITEKIDGTNAQIFIDDYGKIMTGSRSRWITPQDDNFGFAGWVQRNKDEVLKLGPGRHFGEWWGLGIQRGYQMKEKVFSLFNTYRWSDDATKPSCCRIVPVLYSGPFISEAVEDCLSQLRLKGSVASPGFMKAEGVIVWHTAGNFGLKKTLEKDETPKSLVK